MYYIITYYIIGILVSSYMIWYYRYSKNKSAPKKTDSFGALFGPWVWPLQIIKHIFGVLKRSDINKKKF